jgi:TetR/AcrR family transcriptional regulator, transcriptional repressor for nem operon
MLAALDSLEGLRAWRDFLVRHQEELECRGGCPIGSLGSELAETDNQARAKVAAGLARWEQGIRSGLRAMHARGQLGAVDPDELALSAAARPAGRAAADPDPAQRQAAANRAGCHAGADRG